MPRNGSSKRHASPRRMTPAVALFAFLLLAAPAMANIAPDAMLYFNIRPAGLPDEMCSTDIQDCWEIQSSTPEEGLLEIQLFIDPQYWIHGETAVPWFDGFWSWPEAWTLVDCRYCQGGEGWIDVSGPNPHAMMAAWPCDILFDRLFLAMTIVFDVRGYGRFEPVEPRFQFGCPPDDIFEVFPAYQYAEAGTGCEYTNQPCRTGKWLCCAAWFDGEEMIMRGPEGGSAHGQMFFHVADLCSPCIGLLHVDSDTPWISGHIEGTEHWWEFYLVADADLTGIPPGRYQAELQVEADSSVARCLPVTVNVGQASGIEETALGRVGSSQIELRLASGNPSSGSFQWTYTNPAEARVRCDIYDAAGREVARLLDGERSAGTHTIVWDAMGAGGNRVRPGVFVIRLEAEGVVRTDQVIVVR